MAKCLPKHTAKKVGCLPENSDNNFTGKFDSKNAYNVFIRLNHVTGFHASHESFSSSMNVTVGLES